jgi:hypothetical protein
MEARVMSYKSEMSKIVERWLLFEYVGLEFTPLSKPFKTKKQAEKAREKVPTQTVCNSLGSLCLCHKSFSPVFPRRWRLYQLTTPLATATI